KVARELKYREFNTDFSELQRELHGDSRDETSHTPDSEGEADEYEDPYAYLDDDTESANQR
ncbi:MAG: DUF3073 family protein, partial [Nocardioidaceae bacterium]